MLGLGVHSDVHDVVYSNAGNRLWTSCDGGMYRSDRPTSLAGFFPCNDGLSIIEPNYLANHPIAEGYIVTGLQDNGVIERLSSSVWRLAEGGDGGSVVFDPVSPTRFISQYVRGTYRASDGSFRWNSPNNLLRRAGTLSSTEDNDSSFYSTAVGTQTHARRKYGRADHRWLDAACGTPRTLARRGPAQRVRVGSPCPPAPTHCPATPRKMTLAEAITVCRWQSADVAWALGEGKLMRYARTAGSDAAGGPGTWTRETIIKKNIKNKKDATKADGPIRESAVWTDIGVNLDPPAGANQPPRQHGSKGAMYLGTIGHPTNDDVDTLWWFDGTSKWFKTGLRKDD